MKNLLTALAFFLSLSANVFGQTESKPAMIYLNDGSQIRATILSKSDDGIYQLQLTDGSVLEIPESRVVRIVKNPDKYFIFGDGRRVLVEGWYTSFGFHTLTAQRASRWEWEKYRWSLGAQFSVGRQFNQYLGIGVGAGVDVHEEFFVPLHLELNGMLVQSPEKLKAKNRNGLQIPITYQLQVGLNLPIEEVLFDQNDFEKLGGGWLAYPSIGIMLPSRRGSNFRLDFGYKFQRYTRTYNSPWAENWEQKDVILLKSFAMRAGWVF